MKILIIRFSSMGDVVLTTPVFRLLKKQLNAEIVYLTKEEYAPLLRSNPYLTKIIEFSSNLGDTIRKLRSEKFDVIIDLQKDMRSRRIRWALGVQSFTYDKQAIEKFRILQLRQTNIMSSSVADRYVAALLPLGIKDDGKGLDFFLPKSLADSRADSNEERRVAIIAGGTYVTKRIPARLIIDIVQADKWNFQLLGGLDVDPILGSFQRENCYNGIGSLSWMESAHIVKDADLVITGDTGFMHVAAAFQKPIIVIWGSTAPNFGFAPYYGVHSKQRFISISQELSCRPCSKYGQKDCPKKHMNCLNSINSDQVISAINSLLR